MYVPSRSPYIVNALAHAVLAFSYGSGFVLGLLNTDKVTVGGLSVPKQYFGSVNLESPQFLGSPSDGILGLGFPSIASSGKTPYFNNLIAQKVRPVPLCLSARSPRADRAVQLTDRDDLGVRLLSQTQLRDRKRAHPRRTRRQPHCRRVHLRSGDVADLCVLLLIDRHPRASEGLR